jgi:hypothetical protein
MHITHTVTITYNDESKRYSVYRTLTTTLLGPELKLGAIVAAQRQRATLPEIMLGVADSALADWAEYQSLPSSI